MKGIEKMEKQKKSPNHVRISRFTKKSVNLLLTLAFYCYIGLLTYFLFFSEKYGRTVSYREYRYNLELFFEIKRFYHMGGMDFLINVLGNVVAFIPLGFFIPVLYREQRKGKVIVGHYFRSFLFVMFLGLLFSFAVETIQMLTKVGSFDVDDLFLNTTGVIIGYIGYVTAKLLIRLYTSPRSKKRS
ncbi:MAG: VanZ family protein [Lachnoclostridium sp.]|jgi:glycopeptide antibiotics resistance protein|nr:VanZ family protein [Lachnoclostridium sp.]